MESASNGASETPPPTRRTPPTPACRGRPPDVPLLAPQRALDMVCSKIEVPARALDERPYGVERRPLQNGKCQQRGVGDAAPYKAHASDPGL